MLDKLERFYIKAILMILIPLGIIGVIVACILLTVMGNKEVIPYIIIFDVLVGLIFPFLILGTVEIFKYLIKEF